MTNTWIINNGQDYYLKNLKSTHGPYWQFHSIPQKHIICIYMSIDFSASFFIRPDSPRVSPIQPLSEFINGYPDEQLVPNLLLLAEKYKYYRPICGDGNCFYRACMFLYFSTVRLDRMEEVFPYAPIKNCTNLPFEFSGYDVNQLLGYIWREYLHPMRGMNEHQRQKELEKKLNGSVLLDAFLIAYFRSLNHQYLTTHHQHFVAFIEGNVERELERVLCFGRESQGIELFAMAEQLKVKITIMMVHKENFQQIVYLQEGSPNFVLFYRPGHYEILCEEAEYRSQGISIRGLKSPSKPFFSHKKHQVKQDVVRINSIKDLGILGGKGHSSQGYKKNIMNSNRPIRSIDEYYIKEKRSPPREQERPTTKQPPSIVCPPKPTSQIKKNEFKPASMAIPNISKAKTILEGAVLSIILVLIVGIGIYH